MISVLWRTGIRMLLLSAPVAFSAAAQPTSAQQPYLWFSNQPIPQAYRTTEGDWAARFEQLEESATLTDRRITMSKLLSRYATQDALLEGKLAFDHPVQSYLNKIKDHLLKDQPALRDSIRVHLEINPDPGAFMSISGDLRFTTGMFSRCLSEAQVAGIIAHEIIHFSEEHSVKSIRNPFGTNDSDNVQLASFTTRYSHSRELEADTKALNSFLKESGYRLDDVTQLFDLLAYSYLPLSDFPFPFESLVPECWMPQATAFIESPRPITPQDKLDDSRSSHPNAYRRQTAFQAKLNEIGYVPGSGKSYLVDSKEHFKALQKSVQNEEIFLQSVHHNYLHTLYEEFNAHPNEPTLLGMHALWALTTLRMDNNFDKEIGLHSDFEGEISSLHWFLTNIPKKDLVLLAFRRAVETEKAHPKSEMAQRITANLAGQAKRSLSVKMLPWEHPLLCGVTDTLVYASAFRKGVAMATDQKYFARTATVVEGKEADDRSVRPNSTTLLPASIYYHSNGEPLMEQIAKTRDYLESSLLVDLEERPQGSYLPFAATRIHADPQVRNRVLALDYWLEDMAYMTNWNSTISLFTDDALNWKDALKSQRVSRLSLGSPLYNSFLVTFDTNNQRAVDAVRFQAGSPKKTAKKMIGWWLQSVGTSVNVGEKEEEQKEEAATKE